MKTLTQIQRNKIIKTLPIGMFIKAFFYLTTARGAYYFNQIALETDEYSVMIGFAKQTTNQLKVISIIKK